MSNLTITEALAEIKTIAKRLEKKRQFVMGNLARMDGIRDPFEAKGGAVAAVRAERQSIEDLELRVVNLRRAIARANDSTLVTVGKDCKSISEWLYWRRDVAPGQQRFLASIRQNLDQFRQQSKREGTKVVSAQSTEPREMRDFVLHIDELELAKQIETLEEYLGTLDGQLSLKNATTMVFFGAPED